MNNKNGLLRDYQQEMVFRIHEAWKHHRSVMVQMPTGTGKTHVLAEVVKSYGLQTASGRGVAETVLIVAHRIELIGQIKETLLKWEIESERIKVESIQTISRRMDSLDFTPGLIVIDEAHHALAKTYRLLWEKWPKAKFLGLTATPCRMNGKGFTDLFDTLVASWSIAEFVSKGVLSAFDYVSIRPDSAEQQLIDSLKKRGADGDYQVKEMDEVLNKRPSIGRLYLSMMQFARGKKGIVYAISIGHARQIAAYYREQGVDSAAIDSRTPMEERKRMVDDFRQGKLQVLVNVDIFSEGFDCPDVEFVQMARPTLSLAKYLQQVGRGLRMTAGKESCMLIDNVGLYRVFGLPVVDRDWDAMFRGEETGKGTRATAAAGEMACRVHQSAVVEAPDAGVGLVVSHDVLLEKLSELERPAVTGQKRTGLKAWQDGDTGWWGLKRGRHKVTEAEYITVFDMREGMAAVRFGNHDCGLVDEEGKVVWRRKSCLSMKFVRNRLLRISLEGGKENYVDLCNLNIYTDKPEIRRYGNFELLEVGHKCYSRTERVYVSGTDYAGLVVSDRGGLLSIHESVEHSYCLLDGDNKDYYRIHCWLEDKSAVISDREGRCYRTTKEGEKVYVGGMEVLHEMTGRMDRQISRDRMADEERKRQEIREEYRKAVPYRSGMKGGRKVGNRMTVPPIYRNIRPPIGKYCAVEKNYSQWGVISIDGSILIEEKYPDVSVEQDGTVWLTSVTGKRTRVKLE